MRKPTMITEPDPGPDPGQPTIRYPEFDPDEARSSQAEGGREDDFAALQVGRFDAMNPGVQIMEARITVGTRRLNEFKEDRKVGRKALKRTHQSRKLVIATVAHEIPKMHHRMAKGLAAVGGSGLGMGLLVGGGYMVSSGNDAYAISPFMALIFFGITLVVGARLKTYQSQFRTDWARNLFNHAITAVGLLSFIVWTITMAVVFAPDTLGGAAALLATPDTGQGRLSGILLVVSHIITDVCCGYGVVAGAEALALGGHETVMHDNPEHAHITAYLAALDQQEEAEQHAIAEAEDFLRRFDAARITVDQQARSVYRREAALRQHQRDAALASANVALFRRPGTSRGSLAAAVLLVCLATTVSPVAMAKTTVIVLPSDYTGSREELLSEVAEATLKLTPDNQIIVYGINPPAQIARIAIPHDEKARNAAWARRRLSEQLGSVVQHVRAMPTNPEGQPVAENVRLPEVLDEIASNLIPSLPDKRADVLIIGSPFYHDPRDARFSMLDAFYPADGHLTAPRAETPYGLGGMRARLANTIVHICWPNSKERFVSTSHEEVVRRFWTLWITHQGGRIGTLSFDTKACFKRALASEASGQASYVPSPSGKVEMLRVNPPVSAGLPARQDQPGAWFLHDDAIISKTPPTTTTGIAWVGLRWRAAADIDLWARPDNASPWLFFGNVRSPAGFFNKDHLTATGESQFEYIEFVQKIDLTKTEVMINLYEGELRAPPEGVIRVWFSGNVYEAPFKLAATRGNRARPPMSGPNWLRIDLRKVVGLAP